MGDFCDAGCASDPVPKYAGARDPTDTTFIFDASRPMLPRILEQLRDEGGENVAPNHPRHKPRSLDMTRQSSSPCSFGPDGTPQLPEKLSQMRMTADV